MSLSFADHEATRFPQVQVVLYNAPRTTSACRSENAPSTVHVWVKIPIFASMAVYHP